MRPTTRRGLAATLMAAGLSATFAGVTLLDRPTVPSTVDVGALPTAATSAESSPAARTRLAASATHGSPPSRVRLSDVDAQVAPVTVDGDGRLAVPTDPRRAGWWVGGAAPGAAQGTVVIAGHVDTATDGPGALAALHTARVGTTVRVDTAAGPVTYRVTGRRSYVKAKLPAALFAPGGPPRLALITCGGRFADGHYDRNVVVYATPVA